MTPTIEERLARYAAQLDDAARTHVPRTTPGGAGRGPGRRVLVAALGVAAALAIALGIALANHAGRHSARVGPASTPTTAVATTPPTHAVSSTAPTTSTASTTQPAGTREIVYDPFVNGYFNPNFHVTAQVPAQCQRYRAGTHEYDRCFAASGGAIYDPCFASPRVANLVVCPRDPVSRDVVRIEPTSSNGSPTTALERPWAFQLEGGQLCEFVSAAWGGLGPYSCTQSSAPPHVSDCHEPAKSQPWWSAACQEQLTDAIPFTDQRVVAVWY